MNKEQESNYKKSLKSLDTEETFDLIFYRPIGYFWARIAKFLHITPNAITITSIFIGVAAGIGFYYNNFWINLAACLLLMLADSLDSADGQLARMTGQYSRIGRILDGVSGDLWFIAIYVAICLRENVTSDFFMAHTWVIWVMAVVTGICHAMQAAMADYYRQFHLYFLKGEQGSELDTAQPLWDKFHSLRWLSKNWFSKLVLLFYANYTSGQEKRTGEMQRLRRLLKERYPAGVPQSFRDRFRALSKPLMKYTNILSFNTRTFALFASVLIFQMPWLYFAFELTVLNGILLYMVWRHEHICRELQQEINENKFTRNK